MLPTCLCELINIAFSFWSIELLWFLSDFYAYGGTVHSNIFCCFWSVVIFIAPKLAQRVQYLLKAGYLPVCWRSVIIAPVPKGALSPLADNYRPISITSGLSKVYEWLLLLAWVDYLKQTMLATKKFSFWEKLFTRDVVPSITHGPSIWFKRRL